MGFGTAGNIERYSTVYSMDIIDTIVGRVRRVYAISLHITTVSSTPVPRLSTRVTIQYSIVPLPPYPQSTSRDDMLPSSIHIPQPPQGLQKPTV